MGLLLSSSLERLTATGLYAGQSSHCAFTERLSLRRAYVAVHGDRGVVPFEEQS